MSPPKWKRASELVGQNQWEKPGFCVKGKRSVRRRKKSQVHPGKWRRNLQTTTHTRSPRTQTTLPLRQRGVWSLQHCFATWWLRLNDKHLECFWKKYSNYLLQIKSQTRKQSKNSLMIQRKYKSFHSGHGMFFGRINPPQHDGHCLKNTAWQETWWWRKEGLAISGLCIDE